MHSSGSMISIRSNSWMQSTGQTSTHERSLMSMQGSAMMYVIGAEPTNAVRRRVVSAHRHCNTVLQGTSGGSGKYGTAWPAANASHRVVLGRSHTFRYGGSLRPSAARFSLGQAAPNFPETPLAPRAADLSVGRCFEFLLDRRHLLLRVPVDVHLGLLVRRRRRRLHGELLHPAHQRPVVRRLEVPLDVHELEGSGF